MTSSAKVERLEARIDPTTKASLNQAAAVQGVSLTDFVVQAAYAKALEILEAQRLWELSQRDQALFVETLMNPGLPNAALLAAAERSRTRLGL